jgi:hypothetical protein
MQRDNTPFLIPNGFCMSGADQSKLGPNHMTNRTPVASSPFPVVKRPTNSCIYFTNATLFLESQEFSAILGV